MSSLSFTNPDLANEEHDLEQLVAHLESRGPCDIVAGGRTKERAMERFAEVLRFPDWFGHNLDALFELLDEHAFEATAEGQEWQLLWIPGRKLIRKRPRDYRGLVSVLRDVAEAADSGPSILDGRGARTVIIHGPDPSTLADGGDAS